MEGIYQATNAFDFNKITMISPSVIPGGNYFIKFRMNDIPLYIQTPKCKVKQGILKSGKKMYCDLMFTHENEEFICWMENLENYCHKKIFENRQKWFETPLDEHDIENSFTSPLKLYKSGKFYISRTNVPSLLGNCSLKIYNENEELVPIENIQENMDVVSILEIQGIKCSIRSFQIEMEIKQMMVMNPINLFEKCILKKTSAGMNSTSTPNPPPVSTTTPSLAPTPTPSDDVYLNNSTISSLTKSDEEATSGSDANNVDTTPNIHIEMMEEAQIDASQNKIIAESPLDTAIDTNLSNTIISNTNNDDHETHINTNMNNGPDESLDNNDDNEDDDYSYDNDDNDYKRDKIVIQEDSDLMEIDLDLDDFQELDPPIHIKTRDDIYHNMYREAKRKAKMARDLAIASYLEAKNIKNTYMIVDDDDSDLEEESFQHFEK